MKYSPHPPHLIFRNKEQSGSYHGREGAWQSGLFSVVFLFSPFSLFLFPLLPPPLLPTHGIDYKGFSCSGTVFGCHSMWLPPCFLVELSSTLRKVLGLLKIKLERKVRQIQTPSISSGSYSQRFCSTCPVPIKTGISPVSLILTRRPIEFQPSICWGFWEHKAILKFRETKHALSTEPVFRLMNQWSQEESLVCQQGNCPFMVWREVEISSLITRDCLGTQTTY